MSVQSPRAAHNSSATNGHVPSIRNAALAAIRCGLSVVPPKEDGTKAPEGRWKQFQSRRATVDELHSWYGSSGRPKRAGMGLVCGAVSGNLECLEFDAQGEVYEAFRATAAALDLNKLVDHIEDGYLERSPSGGIHWLYRCETIAGNTELARFESDEVDTATGKPKIRPLIETRGEGGYIVTAPSGGAVHPTGRAYELLRGGFDRIATITPEEREALWNLARSFDRIPGAEAAGHAWEAPAEAPRKGIRISSGAADNGYLVMPGEDFNARHSWEEVLGAHGWQSVYTHGTTTYWRRPGKDRGHSATTNHGESDLLKIFTSSSVLEPLKTYTKFGAYTRLNHAGDFKAAAKALGEKGYGERRQTPKGESKPDADKSARRNPDRAEVGEDVYAGLSDEDMGIIPLESIECRPVRWLWKYRLSRGGMAMMAGDGGIGKSQVLLSIAAKVTVGGEWADGSGSAPAGVVIIVSAEDRPDDTIKPRLMAMGADMSKVVIVKARFVIHREGKPPEIHPASLQNRLYWKEIFRRHPECRLFIVDPLPGYLGRGVNDSKNIEIRNVLEPFIDEVIAPTDVCMIGNTHLNKSVDAKTPMHRIAGSIAYGNLPRNVHFVVRDPNNPERRFFKQAKCNNAPDDLPGLAFKVEKREITNSAGEVIETTVPVFEPEPVSFNLAEAVAGGTGAKRGPEPRKTTRLAEWLYDFLDAAPRAPRQLAKIIGAAGEAGLIGQRREDGKWSGVSSLYDSKEKLPELPEPRKGMRVEELQQPLYPGAREVKFWYLSESGDTPRLAHQGTEPRGLFVVQAVGVPGDQPF